MKAYFKTFYTLIFLIISILLVIYFVSEKEVEAAKVIVEITRDSPYSLANFNESERDELIGSISLDKVYIKKLAAPRGSDMFMPGISVGIFRNKIMISEWTSVAIKDKGLYELTVGLNEQVNKGDVVSIAVYVNDDKGKVIIGKRKDVVWN